LLELPSGVYRYRFIVDGERKFLPDLPCETDNMGNIVNLLDVNVSINFSSYQESVEHYY
jgi:5'-AMP-activated protein kinase regulatory beta subunit